MPYLPLKFLFMCLQTIIRHISPRMLISVLCLRKQLRYIAFITGCLAYRQIVNCQKTANINVFGTFLRLLFGEGRTVWGDLSNIHGLDGSYIYFCQRGVWELCHHYYPYWPSMTVIRDQWFTLKLQILEIKK
jgi:hypothetical protein